MDQIRIGKFIADHRKNKRLTQMQLAERLGITDKAVSKWERGIAMPDTSIMLELCGILGISVNELLRGEKISVESINEKNEQLMLDMAKELEQKNRTIWRSMWTILAIAMVGLFGGLAVAAFLIPEGVWQIVAIIAVCIVFLIPAFYAFKLEMSVGAYKCKRCAHKFVPTYSEALCVPHLGTTRYLKCPECNKRSWCKKVLDK